MVMVLSILLVGTTTTGRAVATPAATPDPRPNILLITSDDQTDTELRWMPKTRRLLARQGIDFTDGLNPHPLCCPARAEILTGEYGHNNGVHHNIGPFGGYDAFAANGDNLHQNIGRWMQDAGYRTGFVGKFLNGYGMDSPGITGWDSWSPTVKNTYSYYNSHFYNDGDPTWYPQTYVADVVRDQTLALVDRWAGGDAPFFIWASHVGPHGAINATSYVEGPSGQRLSARVSGKAAPVPAVRHSNTFEDLRLPTRRKPSFREIGAAASDKPRPIVKKSFPRTALEELFQRRVESLQAIDEANAASIRALRDAGVLDNTVVVYVSDNGYQLGEHGLEGKNYVYQENLQIPFLMRAPDMQGAQQLNLAASLVDLAPTFLDYAGHLEVVRQQGHTDGLSLREVVRSGRMPNDTTLIQAGDQHEAWMWRGVRTPRYTWATWSAGYYEFYDRRVDPYEMTNLVDPDTGVLTDRRRYRGVVSALRQRYRLLVDCEGVAQCEQLVLGPVPRPRTR